MHFNSAIITAALLAVGSSSPIEERQSCPQIHIFGARETTAPVGYGSAGTFVDLIKNAYPGSSSEAISYPATGGSSYSSSAATGAQNIANQINAFNKKCPSTKLVVVGYSQVCIVFLGARFYVADVYVSRALKLVTLLCAVVGASPSPLQLLQPSRL